MGRKEGLLFFLPDSLLCLLLPAFGDLLNDVVG